MTFWRVLSKCHDARNRTEYEGVMDVDARLVTDLLVACRTVAKKIAELPKPGKQPQGRAAATRAACSQGHARIRAPSAR
jgi:hypothetical protein